MTPEFTASTSKFMGADSVQVGYLGASQYP